MDLPPLAVVLVAAGSSSRMGFDKIHAPLGEGTVLSKSLSTFQSLSFVREIVIVHPPRQDKQLPSASVPSGIRISQTAGGASRTLSVWNGLSTLKTDCDFVAVHDAARPLISPDAIEGCFALALRAGAAVCAEPASDTLHRADETGRIRETVSREHLWRIQTPQISRLARLRQAYHQLVEAGETTTDEASALLRLGDRVEIFPNPDPNFKITHPADLLLARAVLHLPAS